MLIGCVFFLTTNVLTLTSGLVQSALSASLGALGITSVYSVLQSAIRAKDVKIRKQGGHIKRLKADYKEASKGKKRLISEKNRLATDLDAEKSKTKKLDSKVRRKNATIQKLAAKGQDLASKTQSLAKKTGSVVDSNRKLSRNIIAQKAVVRNLGGNVTRRSLKSAAINVTSIPFESIPWLGAGVVAVVTGIELHMTCDNIKDMNEIYATMGIEPEDDPGRVESTCLGYIGQVESIVESVSESIDMSKVSKWVDEILAKVGIGDDS